MLIRRLVLTYISKVLILICTLIVSGTVYAKYPHSCDDFLGAWVGKGFLGGQCEWDVNTEISRDVSEYRVKLVLHNPKPAENNCAQKSEALLKGTCRNGVLNLEMDTASPFMGLMYGENQLLIEGRILSFYLHK